MKRLRWLVTGAGGMVGRDLAALLEREGEEVAARPRQALDITDRSAVAADVRATRPAVIVNCAAFTRVDDCEAFEETATLINGRAVGYLAEAAEAVDAVLLHLSTDFVFDGASRAPYVETDRVAPLSAYGRSKLAGEVEAVRTRRHLIVRTSWLFGANGPNFVDAIRRQIDGGKRELRVVNDQHGRPTWTPHLATALVALGRRAAADPRLSGIVHYADGPDCTWFDLATQIAAITDPGVRVVPVSTAEFPRPAKRPAYSVLSTERYTALTGRAPASWRDGLRAHLGRA